MAIMTEMTPAAEMVARINEERPRVLRWAYKHAAAKRFTKVEGLSDEVVKKFEKPGFNFMGFIPWKSPVNGDTWMTFCTEKRRMIGTEYIHREIEPQVRYYWQTVGSAGFIQPVYYQANIDDPDSVEQWIFVFTSHTLRRVKERLELEYTGVNLLFYVMAMVQTCTHHALYDMNGPMLGLCTEEGLFRLPLTGYKDGYAPTVRTFLRKEELGAYERKIYDRAMAQQDGREYRHNNFTVRIKPKE